MCVCVSGERVGRGGILPACIILILHKTTIGCAPVPSLETYHFDNSI